MDTFLGVVGIVFSLAIAFWEHRKAKAAEARLNAFMESVPHVLADMREVLDRRLPSGNQEFDALEWASAGGMRTRYADVNGDGNDELLVEILTGPHSTTLLVYGFQNWELAKIAELSSSTGCGFDLEDVDDDGQLEIETVEIAARPDLPYVFGLRDRVTHKLANNEFVEVRRVEGWNEEDLKRALAEGGRGTE